MAYMAITTSSIAHVRLTVTDIELSRQFYKSVFGWPVLIEAPESADAATREALSFLFGGVIYDLGGTLIGCGPWPATVSTRTAADSTTWHSASPTRPNWIMLQHISTTSGSTTSRSRTSARPTFWSSATPTTSRSSSPPRSSQVWRRRTVSAPFRRATPADPLQPQVKSGGRSDRYGRVSRPAAKFSTLSQPSAMTSPTGSPPRKSGGRVLLGLDGIRGRRCEYVARQAAAERPDRHQTPGSQEADVGDRGGDTERRQTRVDGQLRRAGTRSARTACRAGRYGSSAPTPIRSTTRRIPRPERRTKSRTRPSRLPGAGRLLARRSYREVLRP